MSGLSRTTGGVVWTIALVGAIVVPLAIRSVSNAPTGAGGSELPSAVASAAASPADGQIASPAGDVIPLDDGSAPVPQDPACQNHVTLVDGAPVTAELAATVATSTVIGTVQEIGPARWRTADGKAPADPAGGFDVMRLVRLTVDEQFGAAQPGTVVAWVPGGSIGCDNFFVQGFPREIPSGARIVAFLDAREAATKDLPSVALIQWLWPVEGGQVVTPNEGPVSLEAFRSTAARMTEGT